MAQESCNLDKEEAEILTPSPSSPTPQSSPQLFLKPCQGTKPPADLSWPPTSEKSRPSVRVGKRCTSCRMRVGLTGFRCRCGDLFCQRHRYSETHDCSFDYKAVGREEISKANPLVRAAKIIKI